MIQRDERRSARFELRIRPSELDGITILAREHDRSVAAEIRAALAAWLEMAPWLEAAIERRET